MALGSDQPRSTLVWRFHLFALIEGAIVIMVSLFTLWVWLSGRHPQEQLLTNYMVMLPLGVFLTTLLGFGLIFKIASLHRHPRLMSMIQNIFTLAALLIGGLLIGEYIFKIDLGLDHLILKINGPAAMNPGRPPIELCIGIVLLCLSLLLTQAPSEGLRRFASACSLVAICFSFTLLTMYFFSIPELFSIHLAYERGVPVTAALLLVLLGSGILMTRVHTGFMAVLVSTTTAGVAARHLLLTIFFLPLLIGFIFSWLRVSGALEPRFAYGGGTTLILTTIITFLWRTTMRLDFAETELRDAEGELHRLNHELESRVRARTTQLEASNTELEAFSYSASHVLRAPLRAVDGFARILADEYSSKLDAEGQRLLKVIRESAIEMARLLDDILEFSHISRLEVKEAIVDIGKLARTSFDELTMRYPERKMRLEIKDLPLCWADPKMLGQVMNNLISNAVKFARLRDETIIEVGGIERPHEIEYHVKDNGIGFDMAYAHKLFRVFERIHGHRDFEGSGMGLAIVKRIITKHGGNVWADGRLNEGAVIHFTLPKKEALCKI